LESRLLALREIAVGFDDCLGSGIFFATRAKPETYRRFGEVLAQAAIYFSDGIITPYNESIARFNQMAPNTPSWAELTRTNERYAVLARACLYRAARSRKSPISARQLASELPGLGIGQGEKRVRQMLRDNESFSEPYKGRWQLGHAIVATATQEST
jgi:hypothetical protein